MGDVPSAQPEDEDLGNGVAHCCHSGGSMGPSFLLPQPSLVLSCSTSKQEVPQGALW